MAPAFAASADFAFNKPAGVPCSHLADDFRCSIHDRLRPNGFVGCTVFDCFGAGQHVVQTTFTGSTWRDSPETARRQHAAFGVVRALHELLWYLADALELPEAGPVHDAAAAVRSDVVRATAGTAEQVVATDVDALRRRARPLLQEASRLARHAERADPPSFVGADLAGRVMHGADLRGALLIGCDLRGADLRRADVIGADLRGADVRGADLGSALYLTQFQVGAAVGDVRTRLPSTLSRPPHWVA